MQILSAGSDDHRSSSIILPPSSGFTLVEIIIVLLIIGIASGLVGILISRGSGTLEIRTFAKEVSAVLRYARNHAVAEKKIYCFVIDKDEQMYRLYAEDVGYKEIDLVMGKPIPEKLQMTLQDSNADSQYIEFFPHGNSSGGVIEIMNERGNVLLIRINKITGKLNVEKAE